MEIVRSVAGKQCGAALDCPEVYELADGNYLVRGYKPDAATRAQLALPGNEDLVVVPATLVRELQGR